MTKTSRQVLAENLTSLMGKRPDLDSFKKITAAGGPTNGTLDRIRRQESGCSIDQLDLLAATYGCRPADLLTPGSSFEPQPVKTSGEPLVLTSEEVRFAYDRLGGTEKAVFCDLLRAVGRLSDPLGQLIERDGTWQNENQTARAEEDPPALKESRALR